MAMRILVANVNTSESMTATIARQARAAASAGTRIVPITPAFGAASIEGNYESCVAAVAVMETLRAYRGTYDAIILAGYGEQGREGLQELFEVPVVDITEAAATTAMFLGYKYSVVTSLDRTVPLITNRLKLAGLWDRCASVRASGLAVLDLDRDRQATVAAIVREAVAAVEADRAEVICLGCGGMAGLADAITARTHVPVVDGVSAAVKIAEGLVAQGLTTSRVRTYAPPRAKPLRNWPPAMEA